MALTFHRLDVAGLLPQDSIERGDLVGEARSKSRTIAKAIHAQGTCMNAPVPPTSPLRVRVFLASPGDVTDERALALRVLERLPYDPFLRGRIVVETVAWDKPGADTPDAGHHDAPGGHRPAATQALRVRHRHRDLLVPDGDPAAARVRQARRQPLSLRHRVGVSRRPSGVAADGPAEGLGLPPHRGAAFRGRRSGHSEKSSSSGSSSRPSSTRSATPTARFAAASTATTPPTPSRRSSPST